MMASKNRGVGWYEISLPASPYQLKINNDRPSILEFHPGQIDWIIFHGQLECDDFQSTTCRSATFVTLDNGQSWRKMLEYTSKCLFAADAKFNVSDVKTIICGSYSKKSESQNDPLFDRTQDLVKSVDFFESTSNLLTGILGFYFSDKFLIAAKVYFFLML